MDNHKNTVCITQEYLEKLADARPIAAGNLANEIDAFLVSEGLPVWAFEALRVKFEKDREARWKAWAAVEAETENFD